MPIFSERELLILAWLLGFVSDYWIFRSRLAKKINIGPGEPGALRTKILTMLKDAGFKT